MRVSIYVIGRGKVVQISVIRIDPNATLKEFKQTLIDQGGLRYTQIPSLRAYNALYLGDWNWRTGLISVDSQAIPEFVFDGSDNEKTVIQCGLYDECRMMVSDGKKD